MKNRIAWIAALMLLVFIMAACGPSEPANELEAVQQAGKIVMGTSADYPPFEYYDDAGEMAGDPGARWQEPRPRFARLRYGRNDRGHAPRRVSQSGRVLLRAHTAHRAQGRV